MFGTPTTPFGFPQPQAQPAQPPGLIRLTTKGVGGAPGGPALHSTKWEDLSEQSQKDLLKIEEKIREYRDECRQLDANPRLSNSALLQRSSEEDVQNLTQKVQGLSNLLGTELESVKSLRRDVIALLRDTESTVFTFARVCQRFHVPNAGLASSSTTSSATPTQFHLPSPGLPGAQTPASSGGAAGATAGTMIPRDYLAGPPVLPSPVLTRTVAELTDRLRQTRKCVEELEALMGASLAGGAGEGGDRGRGRGGGNVYGGSGRGGGGPMAMAEVLPEIFSNVYDYFLHVAARVEAVHSAVTRLQDRFLAARRVQGDTRDPFAEADRREAAQSELASATSGASVTSHVVKLGGLATPGMPGANPGFGLSTTSSSSTPSLFGTAASTPAPNTSLFGSTTSAAAPTPSLFGGATTGGSLFGAGSGSSLFGGGASTTGATGSMGGFSLGGAASGAASGAGATGSSLFGAATSAPLFGSAPAGGGSLFGGLGAASAPASTPSLFGSSTTPAFGAATPSTPVFPGSSVPAFGSSSAFGSATPASPSLFGGAATPTPAFGTSTPSVATNLFGFGGAATPQTPAGGSASSKKSSRGGRRR
eukprot:jgi/Mesvir1/13828/Mv15978-RA.1